MQTQNIYQYLHDYYNSSEALQVAWLIYDDVDHFSHQSECVIPHGPCTNYRLNVDNYHTLTGKLPATKFPLIEVGYDIQL